MKLLIDIFEEDYAETMYRKQHTPRDMDWADKIIANGVILDPCDDCVSREEVIRIVNFHKEHEDGIFHINEDIERLSSVQPIRLCKDCIEKQDEIRRAYDNGIKKGMIRPKGHWKYVTDKTGHWVWECDKCGWQQRFNTNFCPDCGADMRGEEK